MTLNVRKRFLYFYRAKRRFRYVIKRAYQRLGASDSRPVFILGSGRSGTDIVSYCLSKAWSAELINEDNPRAFDNWRLKDLDHIEQTVEQSGAGVVLFKPIVETLRAREFFDHFPDSAVIFVTRHPYDAINSMVRFFGEGHVRAVKSWVATDFARHRQTPSELKQFIHDNCHDELSVENASGLYWLLFNSAFHFLNLDSDKRASLIQYEDLVQRPEETTKQICRFLGLSWSLSMADEVYAASLGKNPKPELSPKIENACLEQWKRLTGKNVS